MRARPLADKTRALLFAGAFVGCAGALTLVETDLVALSLVAAFFSATVGVLYAASRRRWLALVLTALTFVAVYLCSLLKFGMVAMNLHAYDALFYLFSVAQLQFFWQTFPGLAFVAAGGVAGLCALLLVMWVRERPRPIGATATCVAGVLSLGVGFASAWALAQRGPTFFDERRHVFSAFIASLSDLPQLVQEGGYLEMSARASLVPGPREPVVCRLEGERPDIVMLLAESVMPPGVYPSLEYPEEAAAYFRSFDGQIRRLRVETFGGGTWLTDFSVLTGMSTSMFGTMRNFAAQLSTGRVRHSLPQYLKACGYEATIVYPSRADFAGSARFYRSIGFDRIIDRKVHRAPDERQRDAFYLEQARKVIEAAGKGAKTGEGAARRPQFVLVSTMSNHSPWNFRFAPEAMVPGDGGPWTGDPEFDEYLWRIVLARRDFDAFRADLARDHPNRPFLFVTYGDHQPALARLPLENATEIADRGAAWQLDPASRAFETFYAFDGLNFTPRLPDFEAPILEASHLATLTVIAAGLPLDEVYARRLQLLEQCRGLYATCADRENVIGFQRWLADSGWIVQR